MGLEVAWCDEGKLLELESEEIGCVYFMYLWTFAITVALTRESSCARCEHRGNRGVLRTMNFVMFICNHLNICHHVNLEFFYLCIFAIIWIWISFLCFFQSLTPWAKRAWIALCLHLNHGHDRKLEGEPSFIINDLLTSMMYFLWSSVLIISSSGWSLSPGGVMKAAADVLGGALLLRMKNALREYILYYQCRIFTCFHSQVPQTLVKNLTWDWQHCGISDRGGDKFCSDARQDCSSGTCGEVEFSCHWSLHASVQEDMEDMVDAIEKLDAKYDEAKYDTRYKSVGWRHSLAQ